VNTSFQTWESVTFSVLNTYNTDPAINLFYENGRAVAAYVTKKTTGNETRYTLHPPLGLPAGRYTVRMKDASDHEEALEFFWGTLVMNFDKTVYTPHETARIATTVLNREGVIVCDAQLEITVTDPDHNTVKFSTNDGITVNPKCDIHDRTDVPDYETLYTFTDKIGNYQIKATAVTKDGTFTIINNVEVKQSVPLSIKRSLTSRIFPPKDEAVIIELNAHEAFDGSLSDFVPEGITILPGANGLASYDSQATVSADFIDGIPLRVPKLSLRLPFEGVFPLTQEFGAHLSPEYSKIDYVDLGLLGHDGVDFGIPSGTPIVAAASGKVVLAGRGLYGITIILEHPWGQSFYGHLSRVAVKEGDIVTSGQLIGYSGNTGFSLGPHLHFTILPSIHNSANGYLGKIDPLPFLGMKNGTSLQPNVAATLGKSQTRLTWNVHLKAGESKTLGYGIRVPHVSPQTYLLGPIRVNAESGTSENASASATPTIQLISVNTVTPSVTLPTISPTPEESAVSSTSSSLIELVTSPTPVLSEVSPTATPEPIFTADEEWIVPEGNTETEDLSGIWQLAADSDLTIDRSVNQDAYGQDSANSNIVMLNDQTGYLFYKDSSGVCSYQKTTDGGISFGGAVMIGTTNGCSKIGIWYDQWTPGDDHGKFIHIAYFDKKSSQFFYNQLDTASDTLIPESVPVFPISDPSFPTSPYSSYLTRMTDGTLILMTSHNATDLQKIFACRSDCTTSSNWTPLPFPTHEGYSDGLILPSPDDRLIAFRYHPEEHTLQYNSYSQGAWKADWITMDSGVYSSNDRSRRFTATLDRRNGSIYVSYAVENPNRPGDTVIKTMVLNPKTDGWSRLPTLSTPEGLSLFDIKLAFNENSQDLYLLYSARPVAENAPGMNAYYSIFSSADKTWQGPFGPMNSVASDLHGLQINLLTTRRIFSTWTDTTTGILYGTTLNRDIIKNQPVRLRAVFPTSTKR